MASPIRTATVLVVDDDPGVLLFCQKVLQDAGHTVLQAPGSSEALKLYAEYQAPIDVILTDIILPPPGFQLSVENNPYPRLNGRDMVDRLLEGKKEVRILLMSSSSQQDLRSSGLMREGLPFVMKPFSAETLVQLMQKVLAGPPVAVKPGPVEKSSQGDVDWFG
jgi:CheY-like chemotaxis protein